MIRVQCDSKRNLVMAHFSGKIDPAAAETFFEDIQKVIPQCGKGFQLLTDLTDIQEVDFKIQPTIQKVMKYLNDQGVREILRVIPDPSKDIGLNIMSAFHYSKNVTFRTFQTRDEVERALNSPFS